MALLSLLILGKAFYIQRFQGSYWRSLNDSLHQRIVEIDADRGTIYSEDGQMLSTSLPQFDIYMDLMADGLRERNGKLFRENIDSFALSLAGLFREKTAAQYKKEIAKAYREKSRYYSLRRKMSFEEYKIFRAFPLVRLGRNKSGVIVDVNSKRLSPFVLLANRTIGLSREYVASDGRIKKQNVGLEKKYDSLLSGQKGKRLVRFIAGGAVPVEGFQVEPENGKDIHTTIDVNIQDIAENALLNMLVKSEAQYGTCIVMETATGKIRAMANLGRQEDGSYWEDDNYALRVTEPGSTLKLVTLLSVLDKGRVQLNDPVEVGSTGKMEVGPRMITDAERQPKPVETVQECFAHSSNVGMGKLAYQVFGNNPADFASYMHRFHMDQRSPIDLANVPAPRLAPLDKKHGGLMNMITMSFGYAVQVSPLHTLTLYNAVANKGRMMKPYLVSSVRSNGRIIRQIEPEVMEEQMADPAIIDAARRSMEMVVTEGTGKPCFQGMPLPVAGKTGTAHVADGEINYTDGVYQASFVGYFPANEPKYSCIVVIRTKPHAAQHFGGVIAGPVFREIATRLWALYLNTSNPASYTLQKDSTAYFYAGNTRDIRNVYQALHMGYADSVGNGDWSQVYALNQQPVVRVNPVKEQRMPNVKGMGLKDALYLLENMGLKVAIRGKGKIVSQSVRPGESLANGLTVLLELAG